MSLGKLSDCVLNETRWRSRGFSRIKEINSLENRILCLANLNLLLRPPGLLTNTISWLMTTFFSVTFVADRYDTKKGLAFVPTFVGCRPPKKLEKSGNKVLNFERSTGLFPHVACLDFLFTFPCSFNLHPGLKLVMYSQQNFSSGVTWSFSPGWNSPGNRPLIVPISMGLEIVLGNTD